LYVSLFGQLSAEEVARSAWLIAEEGPLFDVPFAALVRAGVGAGASSPSGSAESANDVRAYGVRLNRGKAEYLVQRNSVQMVPGALLLRSSPGQPRASGRLVAVGDPVYNVADTRYAGVRLTPASWFRSAASSDGQLSRLVESGREVQASSQVWSAATSSNQAVVLTGTASGRQQFLDALQPAPAVIHLATHVLTPSQRREQAFVAFSLDSTGQPELLATSDIAKLHVPGSLVIMSGCSTAAGESREGAGLLGLTRAWIMAGASGVIATAWPVQDSANELLPVFYKYWKTASTAEALRRSQIDMIRAGGWRSAPAYWAAYQLTGGER
jgi:CHAT domain-containing protein